MNTKKRIDIVNEVQNIPENKERTLEVLHDIVFKDRARHVISILETHEGHLSFLYT